MKAKFFGTSITLSALVAVSTITASTVLGISNKASAAVSNFHNSCNKISIDGNQLSANCRKINGSFKQTSIILRGIENIDGDLKVTSSEQISNYQLTCKKLRITRGNVLQGFCQKRDGTFRRTATTLNGIENINGVLEYTSNP